MQTITCCVCNNPIPVELSHQHHRRPQAAGGGPADEVSLCGGCHDNLHRIATMMMNPKKAGLVEDVIKAAYSSEAARRRVAELARLVVQWMTRKRDGKLIDPQAEVELSVMLPAHVRAGLNVMAGELRSGKRQMGVATYLRNRIIAMVYDRFPELKRRHAKGGGGAS